MLEHEIFEIEREMELYATDYQKLSELTDNKLVYEEKLNSVMILWEEKSKELEEVI